MIRISLSQEEKTALNQLRLTRNSNIGERAHYVLLSSEGKSIPEIATHLNRNKHTIRLWIKRYTSFVNRTTDGRLTWTAALQINPPPNGVANELRGITCDTQDLHCITVGSYFENVVFNATIPLFYTSINGGASWSLPSFSPTPPGTDNHVKSISCDTDTRHCIAVGESTIGGKVTPLTDGGNSWSTRSLTRPTNGVNNFLNGIACDSTGFHCIAVGSTTIAGDATPLTYITLNRGSSWSAPRTLSPPAQGTNNILNGVTCDSTGLQCTAVGITTISGRVFFLSYISTNGGVSWGRGIVATPPPSGNDNYVNGVSGSK